MGYKKNEQNVKNFKKCFLGSKFRSILIVLISAILVYLIVYISGGIQYVFSHTMYIVILYAGISLGLKGGVLTGIFCGIILGPLMPIDTATGVMQGVFNWVYRLIIFAFLGGFSGYFSGLLNSQLEYTKTLFSTNPETTIPNTHIFRDKIEISRNIQEYISISVFINNHNNIVDFLGTQIYNEILKKIYQSISKEFPNLLVIQASSNKLWLWGKYSQNKSLECEIVDILKSSMEIESVPIYVEFSVGMSMSMSYGNIDSENFSKSDLAGIYAQTQHIPFFSYNPFVCKKNNNMEMLAEFKQSLESNDIFMLYQPKVEIETGKTIGLEALCRWNNKVRGFIPPDIFIPLVEETQLIHSLTDWVFVEVCSTLKKLEYSGHSVPISINISAKNLYSPDFFKRIDKIVTNAGINPSNLELELTETALMINPEESLIQLENFRKKGYLISLDDYGKGYSSLSYLCSFPIDTIKIDQFFIKNMMEKKSIFEIVQSTIKLMNQLGYKVIAEGVETSEISNHIFQMGCKYAQGYHYAKPMSIDELNKYNDFDI